MVVGGLQNSSNSYHLKICVNVRAFFSFGRLQVASSNISNFGKEIVLACAFPAYDAGAPLLEQQTLRRQVLKIYQASAFSTGMAKNLCGTNLSDL